MLTDERIKEIADDYFWSRVNEASERGITDLSDPVSVGINIVDCAWWLMSKYKSEDMTPEDAEAIYIECLKRFL